MANRVCYVGASSYPMIQCHTVAFQLVDYLETFFLMTAVISDHCNSL